MSWHSSICTPKKSFAKNNTNPASFAEFVLFAYGGDEGALNLTQTLAFAHRPCARRLPPPFCRQKSKLLRFIPAKPPESPLPRAPDRGTARVLTPLAKSKRHRTVPFRFGGDEGALNHTQTLAFAHRPRARRLPPPFCRRKSKLLRFIPAKPPESPLPRAPVRGTARVLIPSPNQKGTLRCLFALVESNSICSNSKSEEGCVWLV